MAEMHARICKNQLYSGKLEQEQKEKKENYIPMAAEREVSGLNGKLETSLIPLLNSRDWK